MLTRLALHLLGRQTTWRLGRALYMLARGDVATTIATDGELMVQRRVLHMWRTTTHGTRRLVVFDVGANVGEWSKALLCAITAQAERTQLDLHIFEPVPSTCETAAASLVHSGNGAHLAFHRMALSSSKGTARMFIHAKGSGTNSLHRDDDTDGTSSLLIATDTVDAFCTMNSIADIHLLKCDTEGHDVAVIEGALSLLKQGRIGVLQFEYNHRWIFSRHYLKDVFDMLAALPYCLGRLHSDHIALYHHWHPELERFFEANYLIIHNDALQWFDTTTGTIDNFNTITQTTS
jgi:FkbM family methyltransferase